MSRQESDREDLMAEATALRERVEFQVPGEPDPIVVGFHRDGRLSAYFGPDPVYHFDPERRLRRAFVDGDLYRSRGDTLSRLRRQRTESTSSLLRHDLDPEALSAFLGAMKQRLQNLERQFDRGAVVVLREVSEAADVIDRVREALCHLSTEDLAPALRK